jgi:mRNA interferase MazF
VVAPTAHPLRGEIWWADLDPIVGSEQAGRRPVLIISSDQFHRIQSRLITVVPMTRTLRGFPLHVEVTPAETGLAAPGAIMCDQIRTVSTARLRGRTAAGMVDDETMSRVEDLVKLLLDLY